MRFMRVISDVYYYDIMCVFKTQNLYKFVLLFLPSVTPAAGGGNSLIYRPLSNGLYGIFGQHAAAAPHHREPVPFN